MKAPSARWDAPAPGASEGPGHSYACPERSLGILEACRGPSRPPQTAPRLRIPRIRPKGTAGGWFLFDVTFYGNALFQSTVLEQVFDAHKANASAVEEPPFRGGLSENLCAQMALVALIGLPGYYMSVCLMDKLGRRFIQLQASVREPPLPPLYPS